MLRLELRLLVHDNGWGLRRHDADQLRVVRRLRRSGEVICMRYVEANVT